MDGDGVSTSCGVVSTPVITVSVPDLLEFRMSGSGFDPDVEPYPLRVRRNIDVGPIGNSRSVLAL